MRQKVFRQKDELNDLSQLNGFCGALGNIRNQIIEKTKGIFILSLQINLLD